MWFSLHCSLAVSISIDAHVCSGQIQSPGSNLEGDPENVGGAGRMGMGPIALARWLWGDVCWGV